MKTLQEGHPISRAMRNIENMLSREMARIEEMERMEREAKARNPEQYRKNAEAERQRKRGQYPRVKANPEGAAK